MLRLENERFRKRNYNQNKIKCLGLGIKSLPYQVLLQTRAKLNNSNFKSELWFIELLKKHITFEVTLYRNFPVLNRFYLDFLFKEVNIGIEIDGASHFGKEEYDKKRDELLKKAGYLIYRINHNDECSAMEIIYIINQHISKTIKKVIERNKTEKIIISRKRKEKRYFKSEVKKQVKRTKNAVKSWEAAGLDVNKIKSWYNLK